MSKTRARNSLISGSLNHPYKDLSRVVVKISAIGRRDFSQADELLGEVILDADQFLFESEIDEPTAVRISVEIDNGFATTPAVIEPGSKVTVAWYGSTDEILATSDSGRHLNLVASWQQSKDYLARVDAHFDAGSSGKRNSQANNETATESATQIQSLSSPTSIGKKNEAETKIPKLSPPQPSVECEHVSMNDFQPGLMELMRRSMSRVATSGLASLKQEIAQFKADSLEHRAKNSEDPFDSLLAVEMGAFGDLTPNRSDALPILDKIAKSLDEDVVARRVVPRHTRLANDIAAESNDDTLVQGQKVPNFAVADLQQEVVSLYDVLEENTVVLIDFWASWCAPCIEKFPVLKEIYADYSDEEFEIVSVSIDSYMESWRESSINQDLPWINLGEIEGMQGPTAVDFGVRFLPKSYIVDTHGCILKKDLITAEEIWQFLDSHFDQEKTLE